MARGTRLALAVLVLAFLFTPSRADACSCVGGIPMCESYWRTDAVFAGEAIDIATSESGGLLRRRVRFRVDDVYRGAAAREIDVFTGTGGGDCGFHFIVGRKYLVFANSFGGRLSTGICSRTKLLAIASDDLAYITGPRPSVSRVYGTAIFRTEKHEPVANTEVRLRGATGTRTTTTDRDGAFELKDVAAGKYQIELLAPRGWSGAQAREIDLADARGCAAVDFHLVPDGRVHLKVANVTLKPTKTISLELIDVESLSGPPPVTTAWLGLAVTTGDVQWEQVPPGRYVVGLNIARGADWEQPYRPTFYPGVAELSAARIITVALGQQIDLADFRVPDPLPRLTVKASVVRPNGRDVTGANAALISDDLYSRGRVMGTAQSDSAGRFTLGGVVGRRYRVRVVAEGKTVTSAPFELTPATAPLLIVLR